MFSITEQLSAATKSQLETQLKLLNGYATTTFEGTQKIIALTLSTTRASVEKSSEAAKQLLEARDPQAFFSAAKATPFDSALAYGRELFSIASKTQADLLQVTKEQFKDVALQVQPPVLEASLSVVKPVKAVEVPEPSEEPAEATLAAPKAAKAEAKAKPATPAKPVAASFPDPKTSVPLEVVAPAAPAKPKK